VADEVTAMGAVIGARDAMLAASHRAREWLGLPIYDVGAPADLTIYSEDPALNLAVLRHPATVVRAGRLV
jgi:imidazolonepropionase-like amidohydrolase